MNIFKKIIAILACTMAILPVAAQYLPDFTYADTLVKNGKITICNAKGKVLQSKLRAAIPLPRDWRTQKQSGKIYQVLNEHNQMFYIDDHGTHLKEYTYRFMSVDDIMYPLPYDVLLLPKTKDRVNACWIRFIYVWDEKERKALKESRAQASGYLDYLDMIVDYDLTELKYNPLNHHEDYENYRLEIYDLPEIYENVKFTTNGQDYRSSGDFRQFPCYWIIARKNGKYGMFDVRSPETPVLPFSYDSIMGMIEHRTTLLMLVREDLKCYYPIGSEPCYKQLDPFIHHFARFCYPDGRKGWLRIDGKEYFD